jgi:serine/threonine protein kinase
MSLLDYIHSHAEKGARIPEATVWRIVIQICQALKYIHVDRGVVHRDLTPANVLIQQHHTELRVKLADFGLAKRKGGVSIMSSAVGTMPYSCPEIIQHEEYTGAHCPASSSSCRLRPHHVGYRHRRCSLLCLPSLLTPEPLPCRQTLCRQSGRVELGLPAVLHAGARAAVRRLQPARGGVEDRRGDVSAAQQSRFAAARGAVGTAAHHR